MLKTRRLIETSDGDVMTVSNFKINSVNLLDKAVTLSMNVVFPLPS